MVVDVDLVSLFSDLVRLETELWNRVDATVQRRHGVPLGWIETLRVVAGTPQCRVIDITRALSITVGGASKIIDRLEVADLCVREPNPTDGRSSLIRITAAGDRLLSAAEATVAEALDQALAAAVPAADLVHLMDTVRRLRHQLAAPDGPPHRGREVRPPAPGS